MRSLIVSVAIGSSAESKNAFGTALLDELYTQAATGFPNLFMPGLF